MRIIVEHDDGARFDITEGVQVCYDATTSSLDWGSGLLDTEEARAIQRLAIACGFDVDDYGNLGCRRCGHARSWHNMMTPSGYASECRGLLNNPQSSWHGWDDKCDCPEFQHDRELPTRDNLPRLPGPSD